MSRIASSVPMQLLAAIALSGGVMTGCGSDGPAQPDEEVFHHAALGEVGGLYESYTLDSKKPPRKQSDVAKYEPGLPTGIMELKSGNIRVFWGAPLTPEATNTVLAYEKAVPESGGYVLMQDGKTVEKMTAEEFKTAPKAPGKED